MLRRLGGVQLDTISVLARSHELVAYARLGAIPRSRIERAYWNPGASTAFEYWSHAACVLPVEEWPYYAFRRRALLARGVRWHQSHDRACADVLARLKAEGPLTATQLGGAKNGGAWWDWSETKIAVEWLLDTGDVICSRRTGWRRVYDLPERVLPDGLLGSEPADDECVSHLVGVAARALGVLTRADMIDYQRLRHFSHGPLRNIAAANDAAMAAGLTPVVIDGDGGATPAWADPAALEMAVAAGAEGPAGAGTGSRCSRHSTPSSGTGSGRCGCSASSTAWRRTCPGQSACTGTSRCRCWPAGQLLGRVDPARSGRTLVARQLSLDTPRAAEPMARALIEAAPWVGCDSVQLGRVHPPGLAPRLQAALSAA